MLLPAPLNSQIQNTQEHNEHSSIQQ